MYDPASRTDGISSSSSFFSFFSFFSFSSFFATTREGFRNGAAHSAHQSRRLAARIFSSVPLASSARGSTPPRRGIHPGTASSYAASPTTGCPANAQCARIWWNRPAYVSDATASVSQSSGSRRSSSFSFSFSFSSSFVFSRSGAEPSADSADSRSRRLGTYATGTTRVSAFLNAVGFLNSLLELFSKSEERRRVQPITSAYPSSPTRRGAFATNPPVFTRPRRSARYVLRFSAPGFASAARTRALALLPFANNHTPLTGWSTRFTAKSGAGVRSKRSSAMSATSPSRRALFFFAANASVRARLRIATA